MTPRRSERYEQRRQTILSSAVRALNRKGVKGMTLGDVAESLDLVPTAVVYYFKNKEDLAAACFDQALDQYRQIIAAGADQTGARDRLTAFNSAYFAFRRDVALGAADQIAVFNDVRALKCDRVNDAFIQMFRAARELFEAPETAGLTRNERNARAHLMLSHSFWAVVWLSRFDPQDYERAADRAASILCDGLAGPKAVWAPLSLPPLTAPAGGDDSAEAFLRAATELINEEGYLGASVEKISARLNVTKGAFYHHNESKDELVVACFRRTFQVMRQAIAQAQASSSSGYQVLITLASALVEHQVAGDAPLLRTSALTSAPESMQPQLLWQFNRLSDTFASLLCDGVADGSIRPVDTVVGAQFITEMINAAAELNHWAPGLAAKDAADVYVRPFFEGLLSPGRG